MLAIHLGDEHACYLGGVLGRAQIRDNLLRSMRAGVESIQGLKGRGTLSKRAGQRRGEGVVSRGRRDRPPQREQQLATRLVHVHRALGAGLLVDHESAPRITPAGKRLAASVCW